MMRTRLYRRSVGWRLNIYKYIFHKYALRVGIYEIMVSKSIPKIGINEILI